MPPNDSIESTHKRKTLRVMFIGYIIISIIFIAGLAYAMYKSFGGSRANTPTPTITMAPSLTETYSPVPSETSTPLPSETFTPQPGETLTLAPYPIAQESPFPQITQNPYPQLTEDPYPQVAENPYPVTTEIPPATEPLTPTAILIPVTTEAPIISITDTPQVPTAAFNSIPTRTPTRIKHPCPCSHDIYDCKDFSTHSLAQACYDYCVLTGWGDAHNLDKDGDGVVCKGLP